MIVMVIGDRATLADADDLTKLKVVTDSRDDRRLDEILRAEALGRLAETTGEGDAEALLSLGELHHRESAVATDSGWAEAWEKMIGGARRAGWVSGDGSAVRAHVERAGSTQ